jgi:hypothetical protein
MRLLSRSELVVARRVRGHKRTGQGTNLPTAPKIRPLSYPTGSILLPVDFASSIISCMQFQAPVSLETSGSALFNPPERCRRAT